MGRRPRAAAGPASGAPDRGFPKSSRLLSPSDFARLRERSALVRGSLFLARFRERAPGGGSDETRLGIAASRKVGRAVARNRIKRAVREFFRTSPFRRLGKDVLVVPLRRLGPRSSRPEFSREASRDLRGVFERVAAGDAP